MLPHEERVVAEQMELDAKLEKLGLFIVHNHAFKALSCAEQYLLRRQFEVMREYSHILDDRIALFV